MCFVALVLVLSPRIVMILIRLMTPWFATAFDTTLWPVLGWLVLPWTTLVYLLFMHYNDHQLGTAGIVAIVIAVVVDLGGTKYSFHRKES